MNENRGFYAILESDLIFDKRINSTTKIIYAIISSYSNNKNGYCYLSYSQLAKIVNISKRQFYRCIADLRILNYITFISKNNRNYLMPTINKVIENRKNENEWIDYNWLEEIN